MKEIGGYFELDQFVKKPYHNNMIKLNTGRNALVYLVKAKNIQKIFLPYLLCNSVSDILNSHKINYEYYNIDKNFLPVFDKKLEYGEYIYIVNYYGQITDDRIIELKNKYLNLILDNTQSFFQKPVPGIDTIYSCRKYFGIPDGAYLSSEAKFEEDIEKDESVQRMKHILGRYEGKASDYYSEFQENDKFFKSLSIKRMSRLTENILGAIDYAKVAESRNQNFIYLYKNLEASNRLKLEIPNGAFAYPYYTENGIEIRKRLAEKKIYVPTLWPNVLNENNKNSIEYNYAANILPIPCDQRYDVTDMKYLIEGLKLCIG